MIEGKCPKCGFAVFGWALRFPRNQTCPKCGSALRVIEDGKVISGYSPFTAEPHTISPPPTAPVPQADDRTEDEQHK